MEELESEASQKLINALLQFRRIEWHEKNFLGYKPSEIRVLAVIKQRMVNGNEDMKVSEISNFLHVTSPSVTQIINDLVKEGFVERSIDPTDRRVVRIKLSTKGFEVAEKAKQEFFETVAGLIRYLGIDESNKLTELLSQVFEYYQQLNVKEKNGR